MSLLRQLWIIVLLSTLFAFAGGFGVNLVTARSYLEQQLLALGNDTAASLALTLTQQTKDAATVELLVEAQFDSGHFRLIKIEDLHGRTIFERHNNAIADDVPSWFVSAMPIRVESGTGLITDGWKQWGKITVLAHDRFAYEALWDGAIRFLIVMAVIGTASAAAIAYLIRWVRKPLGEMTNQAEAIGARNFITIGEPNVKELRKVVRSMNDMVDRVKAMFNEQAQRIDELRAAANRDKLTGLPNRELFMGRFRSALTEQDGQAGGAVMLIRLTDLATRNRILGRAQADQYIRSIGLSLVDTVDTRGESLVARINGTDFAILLEGVDREAAVDMAAKNIAAMLGAISRYSADPSVAYIGIAFYKCGESTEGGVLLAADQALVRAENSGPNAIAVDESADGETVSMLQWRDMLDHAIDTMAFELASFPVLSLDGGLIHDEVLLRLRLPGGELAPAGQFMPLAIRLGYLSRLDLISTRLACARLQTSSGNVAVNVSPASIDHPGFLAELETVLQQYADNAPRIWFEINEHGLAGRYDRIAPFGDVARRYGCKVGIEHFGRHFGRIPVLYDLRLDYLKIDGGFVRELDQQPGNQQLIKAIVGIAESAGLTVIAEGAHLEAEWDTLRQLGVQGATGPYATKVFAASGRH